MGLEYPFLINTFLVHGKFQGCHKGDLGAGKWGSMSEVKEHYRPQLTRHKEHCPTSHIQLLDISGEDRWRGGVQEIFRAVQMFCVIPYSVDGQMELSIGKNEAKENKVKK